MAIGSQIQAWRLSRHESVESLAARVGLAADSLNAIEAGEMDPPSSTVERLAAGLGVPPSWLYGDPKHLDLLIDDADAGDPDAPATDSVDPVTERILCGSRQDRALYVLLTKLMQSGDPKLLRAAEVSLQSLVKQSRQATVPWQTRPPGHFEPPSD
ncbi:MAG: helix-turn-helix domain-containing protein [Nitrospiraceae bacterium]